MRRRWFEERGAAISQIDPVTGPRPDPPDLLVLDAAASRGRAAAPGPGLAPRHRSGGAGTRAPDHEWTRALGAAGLTTLRPCGPAVRRGPGRRSVPVPHVRGAGTRGAGRVGNGPPPSWLTDLVRTAVPSARCTSWSLRVPSAYPSQKAVALVRAVGLTRQDLVVKVTRHPRFNNRLQNEAAALAAIERRGGAIAARVPAVRAIEPVAGLAAIVQDAIDGRPFLDRSSLRAGCPLADDAVRAITDLGAATHHTAGPSDGGDALRSLLASFLDQQRPSPSVASFLTDQVDLLVADPPARVLFHGDLGTWNLLVDQDERVRILDWESAEMAGPPLWDLWYFIRSFAVRAGRRRGLDRNHAIGRHLLGSSPIAYQAAAWVERYCCRLGIPRHLIEPLLHTCWMHRAVKERARLAPGEPGLYGPLCLRMVEHRDAPGLRRLVGR